MKKRLCLLFLPLILLACGSEDKRPANVLSEEDMTSLLLEIHLTEASINRSFSHMDSSRMAYIAAHKKLLKKYNLNDSSFKHSFEYYAQHPKKMDKVYERVLDSLSLKEAKLTSVDSAAAKPASKLKKLKKAL